MFTPLQPIHNSITASAGVSLSVKRDDLIHPQVSGNKWRKLKYNLQHARDTGKGELVTFGGAFSNHLYATAAAGDAFGFKTIGYVRGEETQPLNSTLSFCQSKGMELYYLDRTTYRQKEDPAFLEKIRVTHPLGYVLPEGGTNTYALPGCAEVVPELPLETQVIVTAVGTGGTLAGLATGLREHQKALGIVVLKGATYLADEIQKLTGPKRGTWVLEHAYHQGGYAKITRELVQFMDGFQSDFEIPLDPVYTGKMFFGLFDLIKKGYFPKGTQIVALHTGGLQGVAGMVSKMEALRQQ